MKIPWTKVGLCLWLTGCTGNSVPRVPESLKSILPNLSLGFVGQRLADFPAFFPEVELGGTRLVLCIHEIRFLPSSREMAPVTVEFTQGEVALTRDNQEFGSLHVPPGYYSGVALLLGPRCGPSSAVVENSYGRYAFEGEIELIWRLPIAVNGMQTHLWLPARPLLVSASRITRTDGISHALSHALERMEESAQSFKAAAGFSSPIGGIGANYVTPLTGAGTGAR
jgi:hypothetical protein